MIKAKRFKTAEHAYHYEKAIFHGNKIAARDIFYSPTPSMTKVTAKRWFGKCNNKWNEMKFIVMEDIMLKKAKQRRRFHDQLVHSGRKNLIHNIETDPIWGFRIDGKGKDEMAKILMRVHGRLNIEATHTTSEPQPRSVPQSNTLKSWATVVETGIPMIMNGNPKSHNPGNHSRARPRECQVLTTNPLGTSCHNANDKTHTGQKPHLNDAINIVQVVP